MHPDIHLLLHRTNAGEAHRKAAAAPRPEPLRERRGRRLAVRWVRRSGPTDLTVTLAA
ncbi:hypothetical protein HHL19_00330 [Streptomyces sp. R302]|uniref:hypothetical protein n=1 Tax=unclassified Streptomyces TaxID=2593676 RepID=UPI00145D0A59|nr:MULTISPECIES: hypothetical protein [unclassified Streptomyces]NML48820.1 hypothetical protein [Streptomyces sp. R301]NML77147.1 hypothetical protein [Streptomyces sp. R302]